MEAPVRPVNSIRRFFPRSLGLFYVISHLFMIIWRFSRLEIMSLWFGREWCRMKKS